MSGHLSCPCSSQILLQLLTGRAWDTEKSLTPRCQCVLSIIPSIPAQGGMRITFPKGTPSPHLSILAAQRKKTNHFYIPLQFHSALSPSIDAQENKIVERAKQNKTKQNALSVSHKMRCTGLCELLLMVKLERGSLKPQTNFALGLLHNETGNKGRGKMMMEPFLSL